MRYNLRYKRVFNFYVIYRRLYTTRTQIHYAPGSRSFSSSSDMPVCQVLEVDESGTAEGVICGRFYEVLRKNVHYCCPQCKRPTPQTWDLGILLFSCQSAGSNQSYVTNFFSHSFSYLLTICFPFGNIIGHRTNNIAETYQRMLKFLQERKALRLDRVAAEIVKRLQETEGMAARMDKNMHLSRKEHVSQRREKQGKFGYPFFHLHW